MFWGLIMEPQRRYAQKVKKAFHISMAAIDVSTSSSEPAQVMCGFEGRNYLLCTLKKPDVLQCPLNLNFDVGSEVSFMANGRCHIHLTGYLSDEFADLVEEEAEEEEEEAPAKLNKRVKKAIENGPPTKKSKNGVVTSSQGQAEEEEDSDDSNYIKDLLGKSLDEDEEDSDASVEEDGEEEGEEEEEEDEEEEDEDDEGVEEEEESSLSEEEDEETKPKINGLKAKGKKNKEKKVEEVKKSPQTKNEQKKEGKTPSKENQTPKKKTLQGGVIVEEIKEGQGAVAKNGKFVTVYYEGRLKQNNKLFDSTSKGAGFSFRLGSGEVIKGWDIGVVGMRIGGKRKIICPPAMGYGSKGSPPAIPPNSTLIFEVELKKVN